MGVWNIPNTLTITRIIIIPVFITSIVYKRYDYALYLFIFAALSDMFDGLLARLRNQKTALGTFLDPLADKLLMSAAFISFLSISELGILSSTLWQINFFLSRLSSFFPFMTGYLNGSL